MDRVSLNKKMKSIEGKAKRGTLKLAEWKEMSNLMKQSFRDKEIDKNEFAKLIGRLAAISASCKA